MLHSQLPATSHKQQKSPSPPPASTSASITLLRRWRQARRSGRVPSWSAITARGSRVSALRYSRRRYSRARRASVASLRWMRADMVRIYPGLCYDAYRNAHIRWDSGKTKPLDESNDDSDLGMDALVSDVCNLLEILFPDKANAPTFVVCLVLSHFKLMQKLKCIRSSWGTAWVAPS